MRPPPRQKSEEKAKFPPLYWGGTRHAGLCEPSPPRAAPRQRLEAVLSRAPVLHVRACASKI